MGILKLASLIMKVLIALTCLLVVAFGSPAVKRTEPIAAAAVLKADLMRAEWEFMAGVKCSVCKLAVGKFDQWVTSESTESEIVNFVEQGCVYANSVIANSEGVCKSLIESQLPTIIDGIVEKALSPTAICGGLLGLCH